MRGRTEEQFLPLGWFILRGVGAAAGVGGGATCCCDDVAAGWSGSLVMFVCRSLRWQLLPGRVIHRSLHVVHGHVPLDAL